MTIHPGFTGTFKDFIEWLNDQLRYGCVTVADGPYTDEFGRTRRRIETVTGGFSDDEALLGRVENSIFAIFSWRSAHRGGLTVYDVPEEQLSDPSEREWLTEDDDSLVVSIADVDELIVNNVYADGAVINLRHGAGSDSIAVRKDPKKSGNTVMIDIHFPYGKPQFTEYE